MHRIFKERDALAGKNIRVRQISAQVEIVVSERRAEKQRFLAVNEEGKARQMTCVPGEQAAGLIASAPYGAVIVEHGKTIILFQDAARP